MTKLIRMSCMCTLAVMIIAAFAGAGVGGKLSLSSATFKGTSAEGQFENETGGRGQRIVCPVTLEGSFHRTTVAKVARSLVGHVTRATVNSCSAGTMSVLTETLPWHVQYGGFAGTLPNMSSVSLSIVGMGASWTFIGITCLGRSEASTPVGLFADRNGAGTLTGFRLDESLPFPIADDARPVLPLDPTILGLSQYTLQVTGLAEGNYQLAVYGTPVAKLTAAELAAGVNLTSFPTGPIANQGKEVLSASARMRASRKYSAWQRAASRCSLAPRSFSRA